jgi:hypothetical protein
MLQCFVARSVIKIVHLSQYFFCAFYIRIIKFFLFLYLSLELTVLTGYDGDQKFLEVHQFLTLGCYSILPRDVTYTVFYTATFI